MDFLVRRDDLRQCRFDETDVPEPGPGEAVLELERFGLTSNNVTYAVMGDAMSYWKFFPAEEGWGRIPVWGFAHVEASAHDDLPEGARVYGYFPVVDPPGGAPAARRGRRLRGRHAAPRGPAGRLQRVRAGAGRAGPRARTARCCSGRSSAPRS